jgi:hypothetical protein
VRERLLPTRARILGLTGVQGAFFYKATPARACTGWSHFFLFLSLPPVSRSSSSSAPPPLCPHRPPRRRLSHRRRPPAARHTHAFHSLSADDSIKLLPVAPHLHPYRRGRRLDHPTGVAIGCLLERYHRGVPPHVQESGRRRGGRPRGLPARSGRPKKESREAEEVACADDGDAG